MKHITQSVITGIAMSVLISCKQERMPKNIIVPADLTNSRDSLTISWYKERITNSILGKMTTKDIITILPVDHSSELWGKEIFRYDFSGNVYSNEYAGLQAKETEKKNFQDSLVSVSKQFERSFDVARNERVGFNNGTDVFGALRLCQKYFLPYHQNVIVMLTDMQQVTDRNSMNFEKQLNTEKEIELFLQKAEKVNLENSQVVVLTGPQIAISKEKFAAIRKFWEKYFIQNNARLVDYSTGATAKLEQVISSN
ncbi:MAG: hypothetical protein JNK14_04575 [Chitinophagaceae bacterium]|nr:hypothetical protein [Chitinophagaceae bacterium]